MRVLNFRDESVEIVPMFVSFDVLRRHVRIRVSVVGVPVKSSDYANNVVEQRAKQKVQEDGGQP